MATARSLNCVRRHRPSAVPFPLLWLAALLLGVLIAHGARMESAEGHPVSAVPIAASTAANAGTWLAPDDAGAWLAPVSAGTWFASHAAGPVEHPHHPGDRHSDELCLSGQPPQGAPLASPCARPLTALSRPAPVPVHRGPLPGAAASLPPPSGAPASVVQQV
ncbi:hypothetical protein [Streptomyces sp. NPDC059649]|uniref:hypothetical protein n=1 Tax=Streptomyces sp. NPDC059649 TaxID=3346895 RepID=UPI003698E9CA